MYVVIFRARPGAIDNNYSATAARLRELAFSDFGCLDFISATEDSGSEVTLSYWPDEESIRKWKAHADHLMAQAMGGEKWYASYLVQVAEVKREYRFTK